MQITLMLRKTELQMSRVSAAYLRAERRVLTRAAARGRSIARRAMRKRRRASRPGEAPTERKGQLKRFILFAYQSDQHVAIFGPKKLPNTYADTPEALEKGLATRRKVGRGANRRSKTVKFDKRPAMVPALQDITPGLPAMWKNSIR